MLAKTWKTWLMALGVVCLLAAPALAAENPYLVSCEWLKEHINDPNVLVIDAGTTFEYLDGHIPGAVSASFSEAQASSLDIPLSYGGGMDFFHDRDAAIGLWSSTDSHVIQEALRTMGINNTTRVIIYDHGQLMKAARLFFELVYWNFDNVAILDGTYKKWVEQGNATSKEVTLASKGALTLPSEPNRALISFTDDVLAASRYTDDNQIFSVLSDSVHYKDRYYYRRGHIPTAINLPATEFTNADYTYKSPEEIMKMFIFMGGDPKKHIHTH